MHYAGQQEGHAHINDDSKHDWSHARGVIAGVQNANSNGELATYLQQAVAAIGSYRSELQSQLPAPVSSLTDLKSVTGLDIALAGQAATYVLQQLGSGNYDKVRPSISDFNC
jgi:hypothetical protein